MSNQQAFKQGGSSVAIFRLSEDHANVVNATTNAVISTPAFSDAAIVLKRDTSKSLVVETSGITYDEAGLPTIAVQTNIAEVISFMKTAAPRKAGAATQAMDELRDEEGGYTVGGGAATGGIPYLIVHAGPSNGTKRVLSAMIATIKPSSGSRTHQAGAWLKPTFEAVAVACKKTGGFVIAQACLDTEKFGTVAAGDRTIPLDEYIVESFVDLAA